MGLIMFITQLGLAILIAPLISGIITKIKNNLRFRQGQTIFQPYFNFFKLLTKQEVISNDASWIFKFTPFIVLASSLTALAISPLFSNLMINNHIGDFIVIIFILALARFFLTLAGLDTGSSFGGMGSSREMFISSLAEPITCLSLFSLALTCKTTNSALIGGNSWSAIIAGLAILMVILAETTRIPIDNQETHLELTMVHEAMVLEYSGRSLALLELGAYIKQVVWFILLSNIFFPTYSLNEPIFTIVIINLAKIIFISVAIAIIEVSMAKMRLFRVVDFFGLGLILAVVALVCAILGV